MTGARIAPTPPTRSPLRRLRAWWAPARAHRTRGRSWLSAAVAALLVLAYLVWWLSYTGAHLPPETYDRRPSGAVAQSRAQDFQLTSITLVEALNDKYDQPKPAPANAVWAVVRMNVTARAAQPSPLCVVSLVGDREEVWDPEFILVSRDAASCLPDGFEVGRGYPTETIFEIPRSAAGHLAGVGVPQYSGADEPLLTVAIDPSVLPRG